MELFKRRYLCFLSFIFLFASVLTYHIFAELKIIFIIFFAFLAICAAVCLFIFKKIRFTLLVILLSLLLMVLAIFNSFLFITLPSQKALAYRGRYSAQVEILSLEYSDKGTYEYSARLLQAGDERVDIKAYLVCDFDTEFSYGDRIVAVVDSEAVEIGSNNGMDKDTLLLLEVDPSQPVLYAESESPNLFSFDWIRSLTRAMRASLCDYIDSLFGEDSALVKGMLIDERSGFSTYTKAQFNRSGTLHILSVSGLHVSLLLGVFEVVLKRLLVPKKLRIAVIVICGTVMLALTDFTPSAARSVLMLFAVYLNYMLAEENDAPTSLFVAVALIVLFSPFSVVDIGMWLSFGATLGLVTVYPHLDRCLSKAVKGVSRCKRLIGSGIAVLNALILSVVANMFVLPLMWYFFGTLSLASLPCNLLLSPLCSLFLPLCVISLVLGKLGFVGKMLIFLTKTVGTLIMKVVSLFADLRLATVSLRYPFATVLVIIFTVWMAVFMVIRLKRKLLICLPTLFFAASFSLCVLTFNLFADTELQYLGRNDDEIIFAQRAGEVSVCDMTDASSASHKLVFDNLCEYSVEIENYVLTSISVNHPYTLERIYGETVIRNLYIPLCTDADTLSYAEQIYEMSQKYHTKVIFYNSGDEIELFKNLRMRAFFEMGNNANSVFMSFYNSQRILTYTDSSRSKAACAIGAQSSYFLLGSHGTQSGEEKIRKYGFEDTAIILSQRNMASEIEGSVGYIIEPENGLREFTVAIE